ncbi:hypothetical protein PL8927_790158 [Planktothrix serta PCC 8927]|uniref:Uncharacterized protein n=1 Tax=Planktothrix serta PCC 8927 TaxID=671068 RepID=A0A7Z9C288_9CYAN|nr:hypothetical protein PL8927_790158 [Planktothrix serta PCC 8927]
MGIVHPTIIENLNTKNPKPTLTSTTDQYMVISINITRYSCNNTGRNLLGRRTH